MQISSLLYRIVIVVTYLVVNEQAYVVASVGVELEQLLDMKLLEAVEYIYYFEEKRYIHTAMSDFRSLYRFTIIRTSGSSIAFI